MSFNYVLIAVFALFFGNIHIDEDGTKVIIYGGRLENGTITGDIWILDTVAQKWAQGVPNQQRMYAVCTIAGDQFLVYGGLSADIVAPSQELLIYNYVTGNWTAQYTPPAFYMDLKPPPDLTRTTAL